VRPYATPPTLGRGVFSVESNANLTHMKWFANPQSLPCGEPRRTVSLMDITPYAQT
jgi:hypothetical protein